MKMNSIITGLCPGVTSRRLSRGLPVLAALFCAMLGGSLAAQTFTTLYSFSGYDGGKPRGDLVLSGSTLYGTTYVGGTSWGAGTIGWGYGSVFAINVDGTGFQTLYNFGDGIDGAQPGGGVILSGDALYGTTEDAFYGDAVPGYNTGGTVFAIKTNGTGFTVLHDFTIPISSTNSDGANPDSGLVLSGSTLYGVTPNGGISGHGVVFRVNVDGNGFATLHSTASEPNPFAEPSSDLVISGTTIYGATQTGGQWGRGAIYALASDGTGFTNLYSFTSGSGNPLVNADGAFPRGLALSGTRLYGTTDGGGASGYGTLFALNTDGTSFRTLHTFTAPGLALPGQSYTTNLDGYYARGLIASGNLLYGVTYAGGSSGNGTVFSINTDGTGFTTLYSFSAHFPSPCPCPNPDGALPSSRLILFGNTLYGTTSGSGAFGYGTVFSIALPVTPPTLSISMVPGNVILTWPTNVTGFTLQSTGDLNTWTNTLPSKVVVNGLNTVTNPMSGLQLFFRLSQ